MIALIGGAVALALGGALLFGGRSSAASSSGGSSGGGSGGGSIDLVVTGRAAELDAILVEAGLSKNWRAFCLLTAAGESNFVSNVYLGPPDRQPPGTVLSSAWESIGQSEYQATITAYNRNADLWADCSWGKDRYTTAGGLFGFLAPNAVYAYRNTALRCLDPWSIYDAVEAVPMFLAMCKRIMGNARFKINGDWLDLRLGIGALARMGLEAQREDMIEKLESRGHLERVGLPRSWLFGKVEPLSVDVVALREKLLAKFGGAIALGAGPAWPGSELGDAPPVLGAAPDLTPRWRSTFLADLPVFEVVTGGAELGDDLPVILGLGPVEEQLGATDLRARWLLPELVFALDGPEGLVGAADDLASALVAAEGRFGRLPIVVGVGPDGAALAYAIAANEGYATSLVVAAGGALPPELYPAAPQFVTLNAPPVVGIHGTSDPGVPIEFVVDTLTAFEVAGHEVDYVELDYGLGFDPGQLWPVILHVLRRDA